MIYYVADLHLFDSRILKMCNRPFSTMDEMMCEIRAYWNTKVGEKDTVYLLGDVATDLIDEAIKYIKELNGKKVLVYGNHDEQFLGHYRDSGCFEAVESLLSIIDEGRDVTLCHYPLLSFKESTRNGYHVFGHTHNNPAEYNRYVIDQNSHAFNAGVDVTDFQVCSLDDLISKKNPEWLSKIKLSDAERKKIIGWIDIVGIERYQLIYDLASDKGKQEIGYYDITESAKYEARLAEIVFKSVKYIESSMCEKLSRNVPHQVLNEMTFGQIVNNYISLAIEDKDNHQKKNLHAVLKLRNMVCHNSFLFDRSKLPDCYIDGKKKKDLKSNIINIIRQLPDDDMKQRRVDSINAFKRYIINETKDTKIVPNHIAIDISLSEVGL